MPRNQCISTVHRFAVSSVNQSHKYPVRWITGNEVVAHVPQSSGEPLPIHVPTSLLCLLADKLFLSLCPWVPNGNLQQCKTYIAIGTVFGNKNHCPNTTRPSSKPHVFKCNRWLDGDLLLAYRILFHKRARGGLSFVHEGFVKPIQESVCAGVAQKRKGPTGKPIVAL